MKLSPAIEKLVATAERQESTARKRNGNGQKRPKRVRSIAPSATRTETARAREARKARESRQAVRGRIELLKYELRKSREQSRKEVAAIRKRRNVSRAKLQTQIRRFRAKWRAWVNARVAEFRQKHRDVWNKRIDSARAQMHRLQAEIEAERRYQADYRKAAASQRKAAKSQPGAARRRGIEARQESDQRVESNLPADLKPIWRKVKSRIKTKHANKTRTEAFFEWVAENADEVVAMQAREQERQWEEIPGEMAEYERRMYEQGEYPGSSDVPF